MMRRRLSHRHRIIVGTSSRATAARAASAASTVAMASIAHETMAYGGRSHHTRRISAVGYPPLAFSPLQSEGGTAWATSDWDINKNAALQ
jgi:hypothetical protein